MLRNINLSSFAQYHFKNLLFSAKQLKNFSDQKKSPGKVSSNFKDLVNMAPGQKLILQGNAVFALGVVHAGYHAADGYPGTPSTEVIDRSLSRVPKHIISAQWSVNEANAAGVGFGRSMGGQDCVVTMKIPGIFQAGDAVSSTAFCTVPRGALTYYVVSDYSPASTQHLIDPRPFFTSTCLPVLEPHDHQSLYESPRIAADISHKFNTPVVILTSDILAHAEGMFNTKECRQVTVKQLESIGTKFKTLPVFARMNYDRVIKERMPALREYFQNFYNHIPGSEEWGIIVNGGSYLVVREAIEALEHKPSVLVLKATNPLPQKQIEKFIAQNKKTFVIEDGYRFISDSIKAMGLDVIGKDLQSTITHWSPREVLKFLVQQDVVSADVLPKSVTLPNKIARPPSNCPGCPYVAFDLAAQKLKRDGKLFGVFGDIGCYSLLPCLNLLQYMGGSDALRQGFVLARPEMADKVISVIGDGTEIHSGLDATRNAIFKGVPGVKVILNNNIIAMTGGQTTTTSDKNMVGKPNKFNLAEVLRGEGAVVKEVDAYNREEVANILTEALEKAKQNIFTTIVVNGKCLDLLAASKREPALEIDLNKCNMCGQCYDICEGLQAREIDGKELPPVFTDLCTNCGSSTPICMQACKIGAIKVKTKKDTNVKDKKPETTTTKPMEISEISSENSFVNLPNNLRVAVRGVGGQGNLFFGKILSSVVSKTPYIDENIMRGETHGMAQRGGSVVSTFGCGKVFSPIPADGTVDVLVVMEMAELLNPGFLDLLKPNGTILINEYSRLPRSFDGNYPTLDELKNHLKGYNVITVKAQDMAYELGDKTGKISNVIMLGALSKIDPFNKISEDIWSRALFEATNSDAIRRLNDQAFKEGYKIGQRLIQENFMTSKSEPFSV